MDENIVQQVRRIEAEADRIAEEASGRARQLDESLDSELTNLRQEHEQALRDRVNALKETLAQQTAARLAQIEDDAKKAMASLDALDPQTVKQAIELILSRLREEGACQ